MFVGCTTQTLGDCIEHHVDWNKTRDLDLYFAMAKDNFKWYAYLLYKGFCSAEEAEKTKDRWIEILQPNLQGEPNPALVRHVWKENLKLAGEKRRRLLQTTGNVKHHQEEPKPKCDEEKVTTRETLYYWANREEILAKRKAKRKSKREAAL